MGFRGAGCMFADQTYILGGYQNRKQFPKVSGLGGKPIGNESPYETAIRETVEELFEFSTIPTVLLNELHSILIPKTYFLNSGFVTYVFAMEQLDTFLQIVASYNLKSPLYVTIPLTLMDLILKRRIQTSFTPEISHLVLVPIAYTHTLSYLDSEYLCDIRLMKKAVNN